jgi:hypothetical protein
MLNNQELAARILSARLQRSRGKDPAATAIPAMHPAGVQSGKSP